MRRERITWRPAALAAAARLHSHHAAAHLPPPPLPLQPKLSDVFRALGIPVDVPGARDRHHAGWHWFRAAAAIAGNLLMVACPVLLSVMAFASTWPRAGNVLSIIAQSLMAGGSLATLGAVTTPEKPLQRLVAMMPTFS